MGHITSLARILLLVAGCLIALAGLELLAGNPSWLGQPALSLPTPTASPGTVSLAWHAWMRGNWPTPAPSLTPTPHPFPPEVTPPPLPSPDYGMQAFMGWWRPYRSNHDLELIRDAGFTWVKQIFAWCGPTAGRSEAEAPSHSQIRPC